MYIANVATASRVASSPIVAARPDPLFPECVDAHRFEHHLRLLTRWFRVLPLTVAVR